MSSSYQHQLGATRRKGRLQQNLQLNKRLHFQPTTGHSTTKNKKHSVVRTLERHLDGDDYILGGVQEQQPPRRGGLQFAAHSLEHSADRHRDPKESVERGNQLIKDYSAVPTQVSLRQRHPSRGQSSNNDSSVGVYSGGAGLIYNISTSPMFVQDNAAIQQYSSIPVAKAFTNATLKRQSAMASAGTSSLEMNKQASALMKMYGNTGNVYRKQQLKSVDKKAHPIVAAAGYTTNYQMYQPQQHATQSNSKLSTSYQLHSEKSHRKSLGGNATLQNLSANSNALQSLNSSVVSGSNTLLHQYLAHSSSNNIASLDSQRYLVQRNASNQSQTYTKYRQSLGDQSSYRKTAARVSSKNILRSRYNPQSNGMSIQPLEELRNQFNQDKKNSVNNHKNLLIQQNEVLNSSVPQLDASDLLNRSEDRFRRGTTTQKYQGLGIQGNLSQTTVGSSSRRLPVKGFGDTKELTPGEPATDTVLYLKNQEVATKSKQFFDEGKAYLMDKNYKDAIRCFTQAIKTLPGNLDAKYYRAICHLDLENTRKCIQDLNELIDADASYNQTVYVILSIAYRRENDINNSLRALSRGIQRFPRYVEAYQARGQIHIYLKQFEKALVDFQSVIKISPKAGSGYIGQADSLKGIGNFKEALQSYNQALQVDARCRGQAIFKRAILYYQLKSYEESLIDFEMLLEENDKNAKAHYYKGKILKKKSLENEAILHFEQVIKNTGEGGLSPTRAGEQHNMSAISILPGGLSSDEQLAGNSLFEIAKIRIAQKDFYEAFHNLQRAIHYDFRSRKFLQYKMFVEGVLFLMKRKVKKGVKMLSGLLEGDGSPSASKRQLPAKQAPATLEPQGELHQLKPYLVHLIYVYRAYGLIITSNFDKALTDLNSAAKIKKLEQASIYNRYIAQALIKMEKKDLAGVRSILCQAEQKFPGNKDPYKFQAICIVQSVLSDMVDIDNPKKKQAILEARAILDRALEKSPRDINLLYLRGLLLYYCHSFYEALIDFDAVIDLDEEPTAKYYVARGRCHACLSMFQEAISDLTKAIELDEEISDAYFNRGKCAYLLGDTALAFLDFQKLILLEPKNPMVHIYAGNLLMTTGSYDDATKAFTNADSVQKSSLAFYQRSRCHIALANMDEALKDLNLVVERSPQDKIAFVDRECLNALKLTIQATNFTQNDTVTPSSQPATKSGYDIAPFERAVVTYTKLLSTQVDIEKNITQSISVVRQHQQIIPNVKRIKIEKVRALRRKKVKDETFGAPGMKRHRKVKNAFDVSDQADSQLKAQASAIEPFSYYKENIFGQEDFYLYRGVMHFYIGSYEKAISDFEASIRSKQEQKDEANEGGDTMSSASNQTDLSDVGLCSLNVHESLFNIVLCFIQMRDYIQALERVSKLVHEAPKRYTKSLYLIRGLLYQALGNAGKSKGDLDVVQRLCSQDTQQQVNIHQEYMLKKQPVSLCPFPLGSRLCSLYPEIKVSIPQAPTYFLARPSFSFPFVKPPNMIPNVEESVLTSEFSLKNTAPPKPEAPWIKRCDFGIKFTDEIQMLEGNPSVTETEEMSTTKDREEDDDEDEGDYSQGKREMDEEQNERHYLRSYIRHQMQYMVRAYSEQVIARDVDLFGANDEALNQRSSQQESPAQDDKEDIQDHLREQLYGSNDIGEKNVIVDDDYVESDEDEVV